MDTVHVIFSADRNFRMQLAVAAVSVCESFNFVRHHLRLHLFTVGFTPADRERFEKELSLYTLASVEWHKVDPAALRGARIHGHVSIASYFRIVAMEQLKGVCDKVVYLDCDIVVNRSITELWELPWEDSVVLKACQDFAAPFVDAKQALGENHAGLDKLNAVKALPQHERFSIPAIAPYFNAGVLIVDLNEWNRRGVTASMLEFLETEWRSLVMWDQDALNTKLWNEWSPFEFKWNVMPAAFRFDEQDSPVSWSELEAARNSPAIVHYADRGKPWLPDYTGPFAELWFESLERTSWAGWRPGWTDRLKQFVNIPARYVVDGIRWHSRIWKERISNARP